MAGAGTSCSVVTPEPAGERASEVGAGMGDRTEVQSDECVVNLAVRFLSDTGAGTGIAVVVVKVEVVAGAWVSGGVGSGLAGVGEAAGAGLL